MDESLQDRADRPVIKPGTTVRHRLHPWSPAVHALLDHLHEVGFTAANGLDSLDGLVDAVIEVQRQGLETVRRLAAAGHPRQVAVLSDGLAEAVRQKIAWAEANRGLFS